MFTDLISTLRVYYILLNRLEGRAIFFTVRPEGSSVFDFVCPISLMYGYIVCV